MKKEECEKIKRYFMSANEDLLNLGKILKTVKFRSTSDALESGMVIARLMAYSDHPLHICNKHIEESEANETINNIHKGVIEKNHAEFMKGFEKDDIKEQNDSYKCDTCRYAKGDICTNLSATRSDNGYTYACDGYEAKNDNS